MILIIDNNEERRNNLLVWLRVKEYIASAVSYEDMDYYVKPVFTVYINPPNKIVNNLKNHDTISVIFSERKSVEFPEWSINVSSLNNIQNEIIRIYEEKCPYNRKDKIDILGYACLKNGNFAIGGKLINLSTRERQLIHLFMFNYKKKFNLYDVINYFPISKNPENKILSSIYRLNKKMTSVDREKLIIVKNDVCYFNPEIANFVAQEYTEYDGEDIDRYSDFVFKKFF